MGPWHLHSAKSWSSLPRALCCLASAEICWPQTRLESLSTPQPAQRKISFPTLNFRGNWCEQVLLALHWRGKVLPCQTSCGAVAAHCRMLTAESQHSFQPFQYIRMSLSFECDIYFLNWLKTPTWKSSFEITIIKSYIFYWTIFFPDSFGSLQSYQTAYMQLKNFPYDHQKESSFYN